jgi:hypothetical protein
MDSKPSRSGRLAVLLALGRVSNLPTVWSNCLAAWLLGGGGAWERFAFLCAGATLLYLGGMFLNDAFDVGFDRQYRPERPIPSGQISERAVWILARVFILAGWLLVLPLGRVAAGFTSVLLASIVFYDAVHKRTGLAPLLMSVCRFVLYLTAAATSQRGAGMETLWRALALGGYVLGLSYLARNESKPGAVVRWPIGLLFAPIAVALAATAGGTLAIWAVAAGQIAWVSWCLLGKAAPARCRLSGGVAGLLAGIVVVDWLAVSGQVPTMGVVFAGLFLLALLLQRAAPAT